MDGIEQGKKKITLTLIVRWGFGILFLLLSLVMFSSSFIAGLLFLLAAIVTIPPAAVELEKKLKVSLSGVVRFFAVFLLVAVAISATPQTPVAVNNSTEAITMPPSTVDGAIAIEVPPESTQVATPAPTPEVKTTPTSEKKTYTSEVKTTPTLDNKGKFDILTSPNGATITVDGISEGVSPMEGLSVDAGTHNVVLYLSGYYPQKVKVEITSSETKELFYTLVPETKPSPILTSTQKEASVPKVTPTPEVTSTPESKESKYQDAEWVAAVASHTDDVASDMTSLSTAASNYDLTSMSTYADLLYTDSQRAMDDSDLYTVSPALQDAKDEFRLAMVQANWAALYINMGVKEYNNGNIENGNSDFEQATEFTKSFGEHINKATKLLNAYNSEIS